MEKQTEERGKFSSILEPTIIKEVSHTLYTLAYYSNYSPNAYILGISILTSLSLTSWLHSWDMFGSPAFPFWLKSSLFTLVFSEIHTLAKDDQISWKLKKNL